VARFGISNFTLSQDSTFVAHALQSDAGGELAEERIRHLEGKWKELKRQSGFMELKDLELK
jgi:hypothetical protein